MNSEGIAVASDTLVIASSNIHKVRELKGMLKKLAIRDVLSLAQYPSYTLPCCDGLSLSESASTKAAAAAMTLGAIALADATALFVPALGPERYLASVPRDADRRKELLDKLSGMTHLKRAAYFQTVLAVATPDGTVKTASATCEGLIAESERGGCGYGYDPLFTKYDYDRTFAQLDEVTRSRVSHRAKAFEKLLPSLERLLTAQV